MASLYSTQTSNVWKTWILMSMFFAIILGLGYFFSYYYDSVDILIFAFLFSVGMNFLSYWYSDKIVLKISGAKEANKKEYYDLYTLVENLSITAGLPMPKVYVINDPSPNAFATGRNERYATVAFTTGLLQLLEKAELEGVIAHELAHIKNKDILLQSVIVVLVGFVTMLADIFIRMNFFGGRERDNKAGGIIMIVGIALLILSPVVATLIQLAISRKREFLADASGALLTRYPEGLASALKKISGAARPMNRANHATAHLFISDPYKERDELGQKKKRIGFFHKIFLTHPPMEERVDALMNKQ